MMWEWQNIPLRFDDVCEFRNRFSNQFCLFVCLCCHFFCCTSRHVVFLLGCHPYGRYNLEIAFLVSHHLLSSWNKNNYSYFATIFPLLRPSIFMVYDEGILGLQQMPKTDFKKGTQEVIVGRQINHVPLFIRFSIKKKENERMWDQLFFPPSLPRPSWLWWRFHAGCDKRQNRSAKQVPRNGRWNRSWTFLFIRFIKKKEYKRMRSV